jgi:hypothetical protein
MGERVPRATCNSLEMQVLNPDSGNGIKNAFDSQIGSEVRAPGRVITNKSIRAIVFASCKNREAQCLPVRLSPKAALLLALDRGTADANRGIRYRSRIVAVLQ